MLMMVVGATTFGALLLRRPLVFPRTRGVQIHAGEMRIVGAASAIIVFLLTELDGCSIAGAGTSSPP